MGKVYDALRRAEEQRSRRMSEAASIPAGPSMPTPTSRPDAPKLPPVPGMPRTQAPPKARRRGFLARWRARRAARGTENVGAFNKRRIALLQPESFVAEQFRTLRARIDSLGAQQPLKSIAVTSAMSGEGKTTAATNLAIVCSMNVTGNVILVDCDLRRPTVHKSLGLRVDAGLAEVLTGQAQLDEAILTLEGTNLQVLPVRATPPNPSELLASERMRSVLEDLASRYDRVILDVPATLGLPDAKIIIGLSDGVLFVVKAGSTPASDVRSALDLVDRRRILGLLLNGAEDSSDRYGYGP